MCKGLEYCEGQCGGHPGAMKRMMLESSEIVCYLLHSLLHLSLDYLTGPCPVKTTSIVPSLCD